MPLPDLTQVAPFYHRYIQQVQEQDALAAIKANSLEVLALLQSVAPEKWRFRYAVNKWSIKEMIQHIIDAERIFGYRAVCIARGEKGSLPGFEEDDYAAASKGDARTKESLIEEFSVVRKSFELLYQSFDEAQLQSSGTSNGNPIKVNDIGFIVPGHARHHLNILKERYLSAGT